MKIQFLIKSYVLLLIFICGTLSARNITKGLNPIKQKTEKSKQTSNPTITCVQPDIPAIASDNQFMCAGGSASLEVISGNLNDATDWHWYSGSCGGTPIGNGTFLSVSPSITTTYYVRGEGGCIIPGACESITIEVEELVSITFQPQSITLCPNANANFDLVTSGGNVTGNAYYWFVNTGSGFTPLVDDATYSGVTTPHLAVSAVTMQMNDYEYKCRVVSNCSPVFFSDIATLHVNSNIIADDAFVIGPTNVCVGSGPFSLLVLLGNLNGATDWFWYKDGCGETLIGTGVDITLTPPDSTTTYYVRGEGGCTTPGLCQEVTIVVDPIPEITSHPSSASLCTPGTAFFSVTATGSPSINYVWQINTGSGFVDLLVDDATYMGTNTPDLTVAGLTGAMNGHQFRCAVLDVCGPTLFSQIATLTIHSSSVSLHPNPVTICEGETASFTADAIGSIIGRNWQVSADGGSTWAFLSNGGNYSGVTTNTLTINTTDNSLNNNKYRCHFYATCSIIGKNTTGAILTVNSLPSVSASANPTTVCTGDPASLTGTGATSYAWSNGASTSTTSVSPSINTTFTVTGTDASGCVNTATVSVIVTTCSNVAAEALNFDGTNDKVTGTNSLLPQGSSARTFTAWIKPNTTSGSQTIFSYGSNSTGAVSGMLMANGQLYFVGESNDFNGGAACTITPNVWTHVAVTLSAKTVRFYINGVLKTTGTLTTTPVTSGTNWAISNTPWSSNTREPFSGTIDEVTVWSRALTAAEIGNTIGKEITSAGQTGLIGLYHFNQGFANSSNTNVTSLADNSSFTSNGTLSGFALNGSTSNWVAPGRGGKTKLNDIFCGTTLANLASTLTCVNVMNANNYQWEFTDIATSTVYTYVRGSNITNFYFSFIPQLTYGKTYSVQVKAYVNGVWGTYGESCQITTPSFPTINVISPACGSTLATGNSPMNCTFVTNATNYEWEITDQVTFATVTMLRGTNMNNFYLFTIPGGAVHGRDYSIRVRAIGGGSTGTYGSPCIITMSLPGTRLINPESMEAAITTNNEALLNVFPNPSNGNIKLETNRTGTYYIINELGQVVRTIEITDINKVESIDELASGIYTVISNQADGFIRQKIVVTK